MDLELLVISFVLVLCGYTSGLEVGGSGYGAVVDAGSSGSRVYIYKWDPEGWTRDSLPDIQLHYTYKVKPGLSSYARNLSDARTHVQQLINKIKDNVPEEFQAETPLLFMATAGLRLLSESLSLEVIREVERLLEDATINPFWHDDSTIRILSGEGEGAFSWVAVNYLNGHFNKDSHGTVGVLEMGGASSQITFLPEVDPLADKFPVQVLGNDYSVYTHSYLGTGQEALLRWIEQTISDANPSKQLLQSPCMLQGDYKEVVTDNNRQLIYFGTGDPDLCDRLIEEFFTLQPRGSCSPQPCGLGSVYQPSIPADTQLFGTASFFFVAKDIGLIRGAVTQAILTPLQYKQKAYQFCAREYVNVAREQGGDSPYISLSCSSALAIHKLLTLGFGLSDNASNLHVVSKVNDTKISWTLGALIYEMEKVKCNRGVDRSRIIKALEAILQNLSQD